jgi:hypothetical protein
MLIIHIILYFIQTAQMIYINLKFYFKLTLANRRLPT